MRRYLPVALPVSHQALVEEGESIVVTERDANKRRSSELMNSRRAALPFMENSFPIMIPQFGFCQETGAIGGASKGEKRGGVCREGGRA